MMLFTSFINVIFLYLIITVYSNYFNNINNVEFLLLLIFFLIFINMYLYLKDLFKNTLLTYSFEIKIVLLKDIFIFCFFLNRYRDFLIRKLNLLTFYVVQYKYIFNSSIQQWFYNLAQLKNLTFYVYLNFLNIYLLNFLKVKKELLKIEGLTFLTIFKLKYFLLNTYKNSKFLFYTF